MWDLRNEQTPIATLKRKQNNGNSNENFKLFALDWNGPSQILSGGSDNQIAVHEI